uniref:Odorant-binding protein 50a, isoform A n=2 Tax=Drosophila melanogaster TaxID=7227 RepID=A1Z9Q1_DROME|eukprot:NP_725385.1 Odorant-binding protein 50a, isoform A [Drosophila melanogaster]
MRTGRILVALIFLGLIIPFRAAKCRAAPKSVQNVHVCCSAPLPNWGVFNRECHKSAIQASCRLDCDFNASSVLQGNRLIQAKVRPMLERAFSNEPTIDAYESNFAKCSTVVRSKYQELSPLSRQSDACDRHALFYSLCAYARLIFTCPDKMWQRNNRMCQEAKAYAKKCPWPALKMFMRNT